MNFYTNRYGRDFLRMDSAYTNHSNYDCCNNRIDYGNNTSFKKVIMHVVIDKKNPLEYFDEDFYDFIYKAIEKQVLVETPDIKSLKVGSNKKGGMVYEGLLVNDEDLKNIWIEYDCDILETHILFAQIIDLIIYDEIPNIVLDRINKLKESGGLIRS